MEKLSSKEIIEILRKEYPKFSKIQLCMARNSKEYGLTLTPKAKRLISPAKEKKKQAKKKSLTLRVSEEQYEKITKAMSDNGIMTYQALMEKIISDVL